MLALFPQILFLAPLALTLLRITIALVLALAAWRQFREGDILTRVLAVIELAVAAALFVGFWSQAAALVGAILTLIWIFSSDRPYPKSTALLALVIALALVVAGPGAYAFDLPL
ncbi:MAG TPA: hypothetical protein VJL39_03675 [Candidatus Paceibacterota bacterium]